MIIIPDYKNLMLPFLQIIEDGRQYSLNQINEILSVRFPLANCLKKDIERSCQELLSANFIKKNVSDLVEITDLGKSKLVAYNLNGADENWEKILHQSVQQQAKQLEREKTTATTQTQNTENPLLTIDKANAILTQELKFELMELLHKKSVHFFKKCIIALLEKLDYNDIAITNYQDFAQNNSAILEGTFSKDELNIDKVYFQARKQPIKIYQGEMEQFINILAQKEIQTGIFITTSTFSVEAQREAIKNCKYKIILIDIDRLLELGIKHNIAVRTKKTIKIKEIDPDF